MSLPEVSTQVLTVNGHEAQGVVRDQPVAIIYGKPLTLSVISDREYKVYKDLRKWLNRQAINANPLSGGAGASQKIRYYDDDRMTRTVQIDKLELDGPQRTFQPWSAVFHKAFPVSLGPIDMDTASTDSFVQFQVQLSYETYTYNAKDLGSDQYTTRR